MARETLDACATFPLVLDLNHFVELQPRPDGEATSAAPAATEVTSAPGEAAAVCESSPSTEASKAVTVAQSTADLDSRKCIPRVAVVWNRSWLAAASIAPSLEPWKDNRYAARIREGDYATLTLDQAPLSPLDRVFVPTLALPRFVRRVLPAMAPSRRIVLITGLADAAPCATLHSSDPTGGLLMTLLHDPRILRWHAENLDIVHSKIHALPIGVDFHTLAWKAAVRPQWGPPAPPEAQALELARMAATVGAPDRGGHADRRCFIHWGYVSPLRAAVSAALRTSGACSVDPSPAGSMPRTELWARMASFRWVASVEGAGVDCHRTWEALALGCGVVVQDCILTRSLLGGAGVPVVFVPGYGTPPEIQAAEWVANVTQVALDAAWDAWSALHQTSLGYSGIPVSRSGASPTSNLRASPQHSTVSDSPHIVPGDVLWEGCVPFVSPMSGDLPMAAANLDPGNRVDATIDTACSDTSTDLHLDSASDGVQVTAKAGPTLLEHVKLGFSSGSQSSSSDLVASLPPIVMTETWLRELYAEQAR